VKRVRAAPIDIARLRLANQELLDPPVRDPVDIVRRLGAVQSQDYAGGKWGIGLRGRGLTDAAVEQAVIDGTIVRTHVLRPTWHFMAAADARWMLGLTGARVLAGNASYCRRLGLDEPVFRKSAKILTKALEGGKYLTRTELGAALKRGGIDPSYEQRLAYFMMRAELDALIVSGPRRGKQFTYALFDERVPAASPMPRDEALAELARRYFTTRGPATIHDFSWWSGLTVADAKRAAELAGPDLKTLEVDGIAYRWFERSTPPPTEPIVHLLPNYDEYFIGFKNRSAIGKVVKQFSLLPGNPMFMAHLVMLDGQLIGGWKRSQAEKSATVDMTLVLPLKGRSRRAALDAARRFEAFLGTPVELSGV
jgi:hypothetical protein